MAQAQPKKCYMNACSMPASVRCEANGEWYCPACLAAREERGRALLATLPVMLEGLRESLTQSIVNTIACDAVQAGVPFEELRVYAQAHPLYARLETLSR